MTSNSKASSDPKSDLHEYLRRSRDALVFKLEGLSEYDVRRPLTPTGTNLLGLVKHVASVCVGYFGETFGRSFTESVPWLDEGAEANADLWVLADETRSEIIDFHTRAWAHADATITALELTDVGRVPWWPTGRNEVTLHRVMVHMIAEADRHAGHADIVRELIDGSAGLRADNSNLPDADQPWWIAYRERVEAAAQTFRVV